MTDFLQKTWPKPVPDYKLAAQKFQSLIHVWLYDDCGCKCSQCEELLEDAERVLEGK